MKTIKQNKILVWAVVILLAGNLATISAIWINKVKQSKTIDKHFYKNNHKNNKGNYFINQLELSEEQSLKVNETKKKYRYNARIIKNKIHNNKDLISDEIFKANPNTEYINVLADSIGKLNAEFEKLNYKHFIEIKQHLTPEQQKKFKIIIKEAGLKNQNHQKKHRQNRLN